MPTIAAALDALPVKRHPRRRACGGRCQGEAVFYELPTAVAAKPTRVKARLIYYAFDLLYLDGIDLRGAALIDRKRLLETLLENARGVQLVKYVDHLEGVER